MKNTDLTVKTKKFGTINVSTAASSKVNMPQLGISSNGATNISAKVLSKNTVEIDDDPSNTYGLASKVMLVKMLLEHDKSKNSHAELFNEILKKITDLYEEYGKLHINQISDNHGNSIFANGKAIIKGDTLNPKYLMVSSEKFRDIDKALQELIDAINTKQVKLKTKEQSDITIDKDGIIEVANMRYDDSVILKRLKTLEELSIAWTDTSYMVSTSADKWNFAYTAVVTSSTSPESTVYATVNSNSGNWESVYGTVCSESGLWSNAYSNAIDYVNSFVINGTRYISSVETYDTLPELSSVNYGDVYTVKSPIEASYVKDVFGKWSRLSSTINMSGFINHSEMNKDEIGFYV